MNTTVTRRLAPALLMAWLTLLPAIASAQAPVATAPQPIQIKGVVIAHEGGAITVRDEGKTDHKITVNGQTKIRGTSGQLGMRGESHPATDLIRGLAVDVKAASDGAALYATDVTFKNSDLKTARQIAGGIAATDERVTANSDRIDNVGDLVAAGRTKVFFASGSSSITSQGKRDLQAISQQAKAIKGYRLAVVARADSRGNAAANQRLSEARAAAVTNYLLTECGVLPGRILPSASVGETPVAQDLDPPKNDTEARRVTVTIAVSKSASR